MPTPLPPSAFEGVVFTWEGEPAPPRQPTPTENPPEYETAQLPTETIKYSFSPSCLNSIVLVPPPHAQDTRPRYHITVNVNCFMPLSHISNVRRGANESSEFVGDFETGIIERTASICVRGNEHLRSW
ncbi:hypothetical protein K443DRAFT_673106 [Laccaria amethystina LaAM-08-1]|uniref:Unplaced genomic scaffold K443scaffold_10, whole genome shotgun sequence n=1 Tax=Laccaria amethystina LaAM-08-1 TaxID=1095629 RepID=A0A0C9YC20_9AGAR|nr:hypothetical protein K443DRAFT_673106 [Laccaria amethystina LaAM-08-1]